MSILGVKVNENPYYAPYSDECWISLSKELVNSCAAKYSCQFPTTALSQEEYDKLDKDTYLPIRQSILRNVMNGPLKNVADPPSIYRALEKRRLAYKKSLGICWKEPTYDKFI